MNQLGLTLPEPSERFDGATYEADQDCARLTGQLLDVYALLKNGGWWSLRELSNYAGCSEASASARLRDLRKTRFGSHVIDRKRVEGGLFAYRMAA